jgi:hypothetical protein
MKTLTNTLLALLLSANVLAVEIPNQFEDGQVTSASQMNENFQALKAELEAQRALIEANLGNQKVVFQGFSAESMDGAAGLLAMQQACHNLVASSHVCKDTEIALSPYNPNAQNLEGKAWVIRESVYNNSYDVTSPLSFFSYSNSDGRYRDLSCRGWSDAIDNARGAITTSGLAMSYSSCNLEQKVACCK